MIILGEEQQKALDRIKEFLNNKAEIGLTLCGAAGTGKSLVTKYIIEYLWSIYKQYVLVAPTHKAKSVLEYYTDQKAMTLHKLLSLSPKLDILKLDLHQLMFNQGPVQEIPYRGVVICDECSMVSDDLFKFLIDTCEKEECKIIMVGDLQQLNPVKSDKKSKVFTEFPVIELTKIYRQSDKNGILDTLSELREHPIRKFTSCHGEEGSLICESDFKKFFDVCKDNIYKAIKKSDIFESRVLAYTNKKVQAYNTYLTKAIFGDTTKYHKHEILTGYENITFNNYDFYNSMDYVIVEEPRKVDITISGLHSFPGYVFELYDTGNKRSGTISILDPELDDWAYSDIAEHVETLRLVAIKNNKSKTRGVSWKKYFDAYNSFTTPKDLYFDNRLVRSKSFDRGYALTCHKSQGSSFNSVCVDASDFKVCRDAETLRQLQYVSLSRTRGDVYLYQ